MNAVDRLSSSRAGSLVQLALLAATAILAASSAARDSVTVDEFAILPEGLALLQDGAYDVDAGVPPLAKLCSALPAFLSGARIEVPGAGPARNGWQLGDQFMSRNAPRYQLLFMSGRTVSILVLLATSLMCWGFARSLYGPTGGLVASCFVGFWPDMLAHGRLTTSDVYLAASTIGSVWAFDVFRRKPGRRSAASLGIALGLACLSKYTGLLLAPALAGAALVAALARRTPSEDGAAATPARAVAGWGAVALVVCACVVAAGYGFRWAPWFVRGIEIQLSETGYPAYLLGAFNTTGFWDYYLVGFLVKTPVPALALVALAFALKPRVSMRELPLLAVWIGSLAFFSLAGHKNIGVRYLLFTIPLASVWIARIAAVPAWRSDRFGSLLAAGSALSAAGMLAVATLAWPNYISYFNAPSGGPSRGHEYLLDSNLDWGQGLLALRDYMHRERIDSVSLAYFGRVNPAVYGIRHSLLAPGLPIEKYAVISANQLWGRTYFTNGTEYWPEPETYAAFRKLAPKAIIADSLYVFEMR